MYLTGGLGVWPLAIAGLGVIAILFERRHYQRSTGGRPAAGWELTGESHVDVDTGEVIRTWFDPDSGERRDVRGEPTIH